MVKASAFLLVLLLATSASGQLFTSSASSNSAIDKKSSGDKKKNLFTKRHQQVNAPQKGNPLLDQFISKVQEVNNTNTPTPTTLLSTLIGLITLLLSIVTRKYNKSNSNTQLLTEEQPTLGGQDTDSDSEESGSDSNDEGSDSIDTTPGESYDDFLEFLATPSQRRLVVDN